MPSNELLHADTTGRIIKAFHGVYDELGYGFLEKVYCGALEVGVPRQSVKEIPARWGTHAICRHSCPGIPYLLWRAPPDRLARHVFPHEEGALHVRTRSIRSPVARRGTRARADVAPGSVLRHRHRSHSRRRR